MSRYLLSLIYAPWSIDKRPTLFLALCATTVGTGGDWPPTFRLGDQQYISSPNVLAVFFKKQEVSQQVYIHNFQLIGFWF